ncbi:MAG: hypothetical protein RLZZ301_1172 [Bacteroidota bacterium]|jgi:3-methyladenine DNA glycosylase AlkD
MQQVQLLQQEITRVRDLNRVEQMEAYMKHRFSFLGAMAGPRRDAYQRWKKQLPENLTRSEKWQLVEECWVADYREMQQSAIDYLLSWPKKSWEVSEIDALEFLLVNKSWWDSIDVIAVHLVGNFAKLHPEAFAKKAKEWEAGSNFWLHRSLLIHQLKFKDKTNLELLRYYISVFKFNNEFFIQKAIGWALREVSKSNPSWVVDTVAAENLVGLAKREALKYT